MTTRYLLLAALAACSTSASQLAPPGELMVSPLVPGEPAVMTAVGANPGERVYFGIGDPGTGACFASGCLGIVNVTLLGRERANATGVATRMVMVPEGAPLETISVQAASTTSFISQVVETAVVEGIELFGVWEGLEVQNHTLRWEGVPELEVVWFDNDAGSVIARDGSSYDRYDWNSGATELCVASAGVSSIADALAAPPTDFAAGCASGVFDLVPQPLLVGGSYLDEWGTDHLITDAVWEQSSSFFDSSWEIARYSNVDRYVIARNADTNGFFPGAWSRFDWVDVGANRYYCQTVFDASLQWDALQAAPADRSDLVGGCGGFSWTSLGSP